MKSTKRTIGRIARNYNIDPDNLLILLWDLGASSDKFDYLINRNSVIRQKHLAFILKTISNVNPADISLTRKEAKKNAKVEYFDYSTIGKRLDEPVYLTTSEIIAIHSELAKDAALSEDPISPDGIKNINLLESAVFHPQTSFGYNYKYPTVETSGAALMYAISNNHSFHNGNKRSALVSLLVFLDRHHVSLICNDDELFQISMKIAQHDNGLSEDGVIYNLALWIVKNAKIMKKGQRPVTLMKLTRILRNFNCIYNNQTECFERTITNGNKFFKRHQTLSYHLSANKIKQGEEVDKGVMKSLRNALQLSEDYNVDKDMFYSGEPYETGEFISKYQNVLKRLSRI